MTTPAVLTIPLSATKARAQARANGGILEAVVVLDVLELIGSRHDRWIDMVVEKVLESSSEMEALHPLRLLGDAPGYPTDDPRHQYMLVRVRLELYP